MVSLNFSSLVLLLGLVQGALMLALNFFVKPSLSKKLLAWFLFLLCWTTFSVVLFDEINFSQYPFKTRVVIYFFPVDIITPIGPLLFFYFRSLFEKDFQFSNQEKLKFLPVVVDFIPWLLALSLIVLLSMNFITKPMLDQWLEPMARYGINYIEIFQFLIVLFYLSKSWLYLKGVKDIADKKTYKWAHDFFVAVCGLVLVWLVFIFISFLPFERIIDHTVGRYPLFILIISLFFYLSIRQLIQTTPYRANEYSMLEIKEKAKLISHHMVERQLYKNSDLRVSDLVDITGIDQKSVSFILNNYYNQGFNEYINQYRIEEALLRLKNSSLENMTLEGLAYEVGFSSRSTFYRAFKLQTGKDPSAFIKN